MKLKADQIGTNMNGTTLEIYIDGELAAEISSGRNDLVFVYDVLYGMGYEINDDHCIPRDSDDYEAPVEPKKDSEAVGQNRKENVMKIKLYQINFDRDKNLQMFRSLDAWPKENGKPAVVSSIYDMVYEGEIEGHDPEDAFTTFNLDRPVGYRGRSMSVSDVVEITGEDVADPGFYYCDTIGFKQIDFDPEQTKSLKETIRVVLCEPGKYARVADIDASLEGLQAAVGGGLIEAVYPFDEPVCIICNEEGKINGMTLNRSIKENGKILDIIAGPFFICGCNTERFSSLTEKQQQTYLRRFHYPEQFARINGEIRAMGYKPDRTTER